jgi:hypothetical protein
MLKVGPKLLTKWEVKNDENFKLLSTHWFRKIYRDPIYSDEIFYNLRSNFNDRLFLKYNLLTQWVFIKILISKWYSDKIVKRKWYKVD